MFINYSNHPSINWNEKQTKEANKYGMIQDMPFPQIGEEWGIEEIKQLAKKEAEAIIQKKPSCVLCQGEMNYTFYLVKLLMEHNILVVAATTKREAIEENGVKKSKFTFCQFRPYVA